MERWPSEGGSTGWPGVPDVVGASARPWGTFPQNGNAPVRVSDFGALSEPVKTDSVFENETEGN